MSFVTKIYATCLKQLNIVIVAYCGIYDWKLIIHNWKNQSFICKFLVIICLPSFWVLFYPHVHHHKHILLCTSPPYFVIPFTYFVLPPCYLLHYATCLSHLLLLWLALHLIAYFTMPIACFVTYFCQPLRIFIYHQFPPTSPPFFSLSTYCLPISPHVYFVIMFIFNLPSPTTLCASVGMWSFWVSRHLFGQ